MTASDGKRYNTDCINQEGINSLLMLLPAKEKLVFTDWLKGMLDPVDEQSKK